MKTGVLGGTFDPPHYGHLELAKAAKAQLGLDEVMFVPANRNPLKTRKTASAKHRLRMVELEIEDEEGLSVSDIEITRGGPSYAVDTLEELKMVRPGEYWFIVGADALETLGEWKEPIKLLDMCRIAAVTRDKTELDLVMKEIDREFIRKIDVVSMPNMPVSSSKIREDIERGAPVGHWIKPGVWEYIKEVGLYRE